MYTGSGRKLVSVQPAYREAARLLHDLHFRTVRYVGVRHEIGVSDYKLLVKRQRRRTTHDRMARRFIMSAPARRHRAPARAGDEPPPDGAGASSDDDPSAAAPVLIDGVASLVEPPAASTSPLSTSYVQPPSGPRRSSTSFPQRRERRADPTPSRNADSVMSCHLTRRRMTVPLLPKHL